MTGKSNGSSFTLDLSQGLLPEGERIEPPLPLADGWVQEFEEDKMCTIH